MAIVIDTPPGATPLSQIAGHLAAGRPPPLAIGPKGPDNTLFGADGLTFRDLLNMINPLQHLPVVSSIYRSIAQDELSAGSRLVSGGLFGGFIGLGVAMFNTVIEDLTGRDLGNNVIAMFKGGGDDAPRVDGRAKSGSQGSCCLRAGGKTQPEERPYRPAYLMNTDLIDIPMYSAPFQVGPGAAHQDRTSQLGDKPGTHAAVQTAGHRPYQLGLAIRSAASGDSVFTLLDANDQI